MGLSGLDVRASGGVVVAPYSVHRSKNEYQWETVGEPAPFPENWLTFFQGESKAPARSVKQRRAGVQPEVLLPAKLDSNFVMPEGGRTGLYPVLLAASVVKVRSMTIFLTLYQRSTKRTVSQSYPTRNSKILRRVRCAIRAKLKSGSMCDGDNRLNEWGL